MLIQRHIDSKKRNILFVALGALVLGVTLWFVFNNMSQSTSTTATIGTVEQQSASRAVRIPTVNTDIFQDDRFVRMTSQGATSFTPQEGVTARNVAFPLPPINITVQDAAIGNVLNVLWDMPEDSGAQSIRVYRATSEIETPELLGEVSAKVKSFEDATVLNGVSYYYLVKTVAKGGGAQQQAGGVESQNVTRVRGVATDAMPPNPPSNVKVVNGGDGSTVELSWVNPTNDDFVSVKIYRSTTAGVLGTLLNSQPIKDTSYTDTTVTPGVTYYYTVTATDGSGNESLGLLYQSSGNVNPFIPVQF